MFSFPYLELAGRLVLFCAWSSLWPRQFMKRRLEQVVGYRAYRIFYNVGTILLLAWAFAYLCAHSRETVQLWDLHGESWFLPAIYLIEGAGVFFLSACTQLGLSFWGLRNPDLNGGLQRGGMYKITRHPLYWSVFCFLFGHVLALGSGLSVLFFVVLELYNVLGVILLENRALSRHFGAEFTLLHQQTSALPFKALVERRTRLEKAEIPVRLLLGAAAFTVVIALVHDPILVAALRLFSTDQPTSPTLANRGP